MNINHNSSGSIELSKLMSEMNRAGGFSLSVLTDREGLPIASAAGTGQDPEMHAAVVALAQKTATQVRNLIGLSVTSEISLHDTQGQRLVCRPFSIKGHELILAILIPDKNKTYRRLTNNAVNAIKKLWKY